MGSLLSKVTSNEPELTKVTNNPPAEDQPEKSTDHHAEIKPDQKLEEKQDCSKSHRMESTPDEHSKIIATEIKEEEPSKVSPAEVATSFESVKPPIENVHLKESHSECPDKDDGKVIEMAEEAKPDNIGDVSLMTEACQAPIPVTPYVENRNSAFTKDRENLLTEVLLSGKSLSTNLDSSTHDETTKRDEPKIQESAELPTSSEVKNVGPQMTAECEMGEDTTVMTKDLMAHHEMALPVEELADQLSNVVISTAAEELLSKTGLGINDESKTNDGKKHEQEFMVEDHTNKLDAAHCEGFVKVNEQHDITDTVAEETDHKSSDMKHQEVDDINAEEHKDSSNEVVASN